MIDLELRLTHRIHVTTEGHGAYLEAVDNAFVGEVDYGQLMKKYGQPIEEQERRYSLQEAIPND